LTVPGGIPQNAAWRERLRVIIFEADTPAGKAFDVGLLIAILASIVAVMLESVAPIRAAYGRSLDVAEWVFTIASRSRSTGRSSP
jgi:voltage-gated potassium channel